MRKHSRQLGAEPLGRQDHTISPSVSAPYVYQRLHVHRLPHHVRDDAYAPRAGAEWRQEIMFFGKLKAVYFYQKILTGLTGLIVLWK